MYLQGSNSSMYLTSFVSGEALVVTSLAVNSTVSVNSTSKTMVGEACGGMTSSEMTLGCRKGVGSTRMIGVVSAGIFLSIPRTEPIDKPALFSQTQQFVHTPRRASDTHHYTDRNNDTDCCGRARGRVLELSDVEGGAKVRGLALKVWLQSAVVEVVFT
ncbi:hypothetical protein RRG08_049204 [Elysia crispata]|uniref:Uncharacterized protein n=1 Tax=Elysia crispata TaxID=231223 RepID=A0AAE1E619_9GAST|nr:hypothetical protein RRG08_049204 [Elysia crispata]